MAKKENCGCGCVPPGKTIRTKSASATPKTPKKPAKWVRKGPLKIRWPLPEGRNAPRHPRSFFLILAHPP
jgi:hypothetical protein